MAASPRESVRSRTGGVLLASTDSANLVSEALAVPFAAVMPAMVTLPGIGHMTPLEAPGVVAGLIRKLVASAR